MRIFPVSATARVCIKSLTAQRFITLIVGCPAFIGLVGWQERFLLYPSRLTTHQGYSCVRPKLYIVRLIVAIDSYLQICLYLCASRPYHQTSTRAKKISHVYDDCAPASAIEAAFASARLLFSPCFPFCTSKLSVELLPGTTKSR